MQTNNIIIQILKYSTIGATLLVLNGCSVTPYKEESACQFNGLGKCLPIDKAYKEAVTGIDQGGNLVNGNTKVKLNNNNADNKMSSQESIDNHLSAQGQNYVGNATNSVYKKTQELITQAQMPLLKPAVVRRVLILPYTDKDASQWFEPRHAYYIEDKPQWALDMQILNKAFDKHNQVDLFN